MKKSRRDLSLLIGGISVEEGSIYLNVARAKKRSSTSLENVRHADRRFSIMFFWLLSAPVALFDVIVWIAFELRRQLPCIGCHHELELFVLKD